MQACLIFDISHTTFGTPKKAFSRALITLESKSLNPCFKTKEPEAREPPQETRKGMTKMRQLRQLGLI